MSQNLVPTLPDMNPTWLQSLAWQPSHSQSLQLQRLYQLILEGNRQLNLTRITEPQEFWEKHLWDSLCGIAPWLPAMDAKIEAKPEQNLEDSPDTRQNLDPAIAGLIPDPTPLKVIDIGTGGGFPGLPIAIACPTWQITLLDSTRKKITFLQTLISDLGLPQVTTLVDRAEQVGHQPYHRGKYDLALIRAVGTAATCAEYALPLLRVGGVAVLYRGQWTQEEEQALSSAAQQLGGEVAKVLALTTPLSQSMRHCIYLKKTAPTPGTFPRPVGVPAQKPLG